MIEPVSTMATCTGGNIETYALLHGRRVLHERARVRNRKVNLA